MTYDNYPAQAAAKERRPPPLWPPLASCGLPAFKRGAPAAHKSLGVSVDNQYPAATTSGQKSHSLAGRTADLSAPYLGKSTLAKTMVPVYASISAAYGVFLHTSETQL